MPAGLKESTKRYLFHVRLILLQRLCQLIRAGSWAEAALDAFDAGDCLVNIHTIDQAGNALCVAGAAADKFQVVNITVHQIKGDFLRANALRRPCAICAIGPHNPVIHIALIFCSIMRCCRL